ncbi:MAG TPA: thioredoxin-disulfide reductase, partial [Devosia sp.]|nr:thioredoxin-disulfide reductase [Devosia sp.]
ASEVVVVHRRDELRSEKILQKRLFKNPKITMMWDTQLEEVLGTDGLMKSVTGAKLKNVKTGEITEIEADGIFVAIGHAPATKLFTDKLKMKQGGYLITAPDSAATDIPGVFAAGDVTDDKYRQAVTAAGMGCMAALEAEHYLAGLEED